MTRIPAGLRVAAAITAAILAGTFRLAAAPAITSARLAPPARTTGAPAPTRPDEGQRTTGQYEKLELWIDLTADFQNPFDPDDVDVSAEFTAPSGRTWRVWGFYNPSGWSAQWMVRFTPDEPGAWRYVARVRDRTGSAESQPGTVRVVKTTRHGFLGIAPNRRYFQFSDGTPFFGVGLWYNDSYDASRQGRITEAGLDDLKDHGANLVSFYSAPLETLGTGLGRYDADRAARLDQVFEWCEQRDLLVSWNIWFHSYFSETVWGGGNARYRQNPYRAIVPAAHYFESEEAWSYTRKLLRYLVARWGYSRALGLWFAVDEINGTDAWVHGSPEAAEKWVRRLHQWLKENDPYGRPTTGTQSGGIKEWWPAGYAIFDVAAREIYETQGHPFPRGATSDAATEHPLRLSYSNYVKQTQDLWRGFTKPAIIGECGYDHTYFEPGTPGYLAMYHNALWATLANGLSLSPLWWAHGPYISDSVVTRTMRYFATFVGDIDFAHDTWTPLAVTTSAGDGWAMQGANLTFGWAVNAVGGVAGQTIRVPVPTDGAYDVRLYRTWRGEYLPPQTIESAGRVVTLTVPTLSVVDSHGQNMGDDVAFKIVRRGENPGSRR